jgi:redox-sensitive bicupin YhaK (pirin superfamily)
VLSGALAHQDSMGNGKAGGTHAGVIRPGDVQRMSAGSGVQHSEFNHSADETTHFLQIWLLPSRSGITPGYEQKHFSDADKRGRSRLVASPDGRDGSVSIHADAAIRAGLVDGDEHIALDLKPQRQTYVHVARGALHVNGQALAAGDAARLDGESQLVLDHGHQAEVLVFDLAR